MINEFTEKQCERLSTLGFKKVSSEYFVINEGFLEIICSAGCDDSNGYMLNVRYMRTDWKRRDQVTLVSYHHVYHEEGFEILFEFIKILLSGNRNQTKITESIENPNCSCCNQPKHDGFACDTRREP